MRPLLLNNPRKVSISVEAAMRSMGVLLSQSDVDTVFEAYDSSNSGQISFRGLENQLKAFDNHDPSNNSEPVYLEHMDKADASSAPELFDSARNPIIHRGKGLNSPRKPYEPQKSPRMEGEVSIETHEGATGYINKGSIWRDSNAHEKTELLANSHLTNRIVNEFTKHKNASTVFSKLGVTEETRVTAKDLREKLKHIGVILSSGDCEKVLQSTKFSNIDGTKLHVGPWVRSLLNFEKEFEALHSRPTSEIVTEQNVNNLSIVTPAGRTRDSHRRPEKAHHLLPTSFDEGTVGLQQRILTNIPKNKHAAKQFIRHVFRKLDGDGDGKVSVSELMKGVRSFGVYTSENEVKNFLFKAGIRSNDCFDFEEVANVILQDQAHVSAGQRRPFNPRHDHSNTVVYHQQEDEEEEEAYGGTDQSSPSSAKKKNKKKKQRKDERAPFGTKWQNFKVAWAQKYGQPAQKELRLDATMRERARERSETTYNPPRAFQVLRLKR
eukprot:g3112.t1